MSSVINNPFLKINLLATLTGGDTTSPTQSAVNVGSTITPPVGAAAGSSDMLYSKLLSVPTGSPVTLDVTSLTDALGNAINMARVQGIVIVNLSTTAGQTLTVAGGTNPLFADSYTVQPVGTIAVYQPSPGFAVSGSIKTIKLTCAAGAISVSVAILGCSA